ncbi:unnamed protein product [Adineta steineri]|uniref:Ubiquitin-like domain-containing protein n=1 Tax=Adineta steineri TaxID=433720 RepID=A0A819KZX4_9BILA|nr:unnamed protein product [Adineta steineri]
MSSVNQESNILHDSYGSYTPSPPLPPVPPFPCAVDSLCTADNRICDQHKYVIFVKTHKTDGTFEIPYGQWESWVWYKQRISDRTGVPIQEIRIVYAGVERDGLNRHSGLQKQSTIHMIQREEEQVEEYIEPPREKIDVEALITENGDCPTLNLMMKNLNANEAKLLMELLKNNKTVTSLDLSLNWIGNEGVQSVADALNNNTTLTEIKLGCVLNNNKTLNTLKLCGCGFGPEGVKHIADALRNNTTLTTLDLGLCKLENEGVQYLSDALQNNTTLTSLYLKENEIKAEGIKILADALRHNKGLKKTFS